MAHCVYLSKEERELMSARGSGVSHCPNSNFGISSGICNVRLLLEDGVKVGLGTDVSGMSYVVTVYGCILHGPSPASRSLRSLSSLPGGHHPSMMDAMKHAILASKALGMHGDPTRPTYEPLSVGEAFFLATIGSASICGIDDRIGNFVVGKEFDALLVDMEQLHQQLQLPYHDMGRKHHADALHNAAAHAHNNIDLWQHDDLKSAFEKFIYLGDDRNINKIWVQGRLVKQNK